MRFGNALAALWSGFRVACVSFGLSWLAYSSKEV